MRKVTENEKMVFEFIKDRIEEGYPPTVREICAEFGFKSTSTAHRYINNLTAKGLLEKGNNQNRAIRLTGGNGMKILYKLPACKALQQSAFCPEGKGRVHDKRRYP